MSRVVELKRLELEVKKIDTAKTELEFKIFEREEDIARLKHNINLQEKKIAELKLTIAKMEATDG